MRPLRKAGIRRLYKEFVGSHPPQVEIAFLLQDLSDPYNVGGLFRVADACGARELIFTGQTPTPPHPQISVTSLGHHRRVPWRQIVKIDEAVATLKAEGYHLIALEIAEGAQIYTEYDYPPKICLILGNEVGGVYPKVLRQRDGAVFIPMFGKGGSLNVHVAAALVAYQALLGRRSASERQKSSS